MSVNGVKMVPVDGVKIQQDLIKNIVKNDDKTTVVLQDGTTVSYGAQKTENANISKNGDGLIVFKNLYGASIKGTDNDDKYKIWCGSDIDVYTDDGNDTIDTWGLEKSRIASGAGNDEIKVGFGDAISINSGSGEDKVSINGLYGGKVFNAESVIPYTSQRVNIWGNDKTTKVHAGSVYGEDDNKVKTFYPNLKDSTIKGVPKENVNVFYLENVEIKAPDESAGKKEIQ